jgi:hypothetical protein
MLSWTETDWLLLRHYYPEDVEKFAMILRDGPPRKTETSVTLTHEQARFVVDLGKGGKPMVDVDGAHLGLVRDLVAAKHVFVQWKGLLLPRYVPYEEAVVEARRVLANDPSPPSALPGDADLCKLHDGTWVYRNHAGTWQTCPPPFPTDQTYEVQQLRGEMAAILEHCTKETGFDASTKLKAIRSLVETALGRDVQHVGGGHD